MRSYLAAAIVGLAAIGSAQTNPAVLTVTVAAPQSCLKAGSPIEMHVTMTNVSNHDVAYRLVAFGKWAGWTKILIYDSTVHLAPFTKENPISFRGGSAFGTHVTLHAGQSVTRNVNIAKEWDLHKPDHYRIEVTPLTEENFHGDAAVLCVIE